MMPLNRTPPATPSSALPPLSTSMQHSGSEPALNTMKVGENKSKTGKRKFQGEDENALRAVMAEVRIMLSAFTKEQDAKFCTLFDTITEIKEQSNKVTSAVEFLSERYDQMHNQIKCLENERKEFRTQIETLEHRLETMERRMRSTCIEVRNIPKTKQIESKQELSDIIKKIGASLNINIQDPDIKDIYRTPNKNGTNQPLLVEFVSAISKEKIVAGAKTYSKQNGSKLTTSQVKIEGPATPIYISEALTYKGKKIHFLARDFARNNNYKFCWTSHGNIFLRMKEGSPQIRIDSENDLARLSTISSE